MERIKKEPCVVLLDGAADLLNKVCLVCQGSAGALRDVTRKFVHLGQQEVYAEMLEYCFVVKMEELPCSSGGVRMLCEACVGQLRVACRFRKQLETTKEQLKSMIVMKIEVEEPDIVDNGSCYEDLDSSMPEDSADLLIVMSEQANKPKEKRMRSSAKRKDKETKTESNESVAVTIEEIKTKVRKPYPSRTVPFTLEKTDRTCKLCNRFFSTFKTLKTHMSVHYPNYTCEVCGRVFASRHLVMRHRSTHTATRQACELCPKVFKDMQGLKKHKKEKHEGKRDTYCCTHCPERFTNYYQRVHHMSQQHGVALNTYPCDMCDQVLATSSKRWQHKVQYHLPHRMKFHCPVCQVPFRDSSGLAKHSVTHTGERNFKCEICLKSYGYRNSLREHMKIHSGIKNFVCNICGRAFTQKCTLKGHMAVHIKDGTLQ